MPFAIVHFFVRLFHVVIFALCLITWSYSEASSLSPQSSTAFGPATPHRLKLKMSTGILSFHEWKQERLQQAQQRMTNIEQRIDRKTRARALAEPQSLSGGGRQHQNRPMDALTEQLKIEKENYEFAQGLTISDYLLSYLAQQRNRKAAIEAAAAQMSPKEVADLIESFTRQSTRPRSRSSMTSAEALMGQEF